MADYDESGIPIDAPAQPDITVDDSGMETVHVTAHAFNWQSLIGWALLAGLIWMASQESDESFIRRQYDE